MQRKLIHQFIGVAILAVMALLPFADAGARTPAPQIATVDMASLLALHPAMAAYDPNMQAFKVTRPRQQFIQDKSRLAADKAKKIDELRARMRQIESQISAEKQRHIRDEAQQKTDFDKSMAQLATEAVRLHLQVFRNKEAETRQRHIARLRSLKLQIDQIDRQIENENAEMLSDRFTTPTETRQRFLQVLNEIRQFAQAAAASRNISIVLDSGGSSFQQTDLSSVQKSIPGDVDYAEVFAKPLLSPITLSSDEASVQGYYNLRRDKALVWHNNRFGILAPFRNEMANTTVVAGGIDLTLEVMNAILKNYRVDQTVQSILNSVIQGVR
ncbi:MAG TPA: hypothetical protein DCG57_07275 [Candidatus Riflebacteria bacterium]|jgi:Skp family chaperone for outer membrane proteins|nr:hypothetical protein [Candidatus Riflebacteria bacterium]